jgi:phosphatidylserine decarboxylase
MTRLLVSLQHWLPHHALSRIAYRLTRSRIRWLKNLLIGAFVRAYHPEMSEAIEPDPLAYASFNDFFTRRLKPQARPLRADPGCVVSPADGVLSAIGAIDDDTLLQAKNRHFTLAQLLAADSDTDGADWAARLRGGSYATIYLAPSNYHRVHMPLSGTLQAAWHVPGRLFSVNEATAAQVQRLFARNERVICAFAGERWPFVVVLVGALFVGSMTTVWHGEVTPCRSRRPKRLRPVAPATAALPLGAELGGFNMGSTAILLLPPASVRWDSALRSGSHVRMGQALGSLRP